MTLVKLMTLKKQEFKVIVYRHATTPPYFIG